MELQSLQLDFHSVYIASLVIILLLFYMLLEIFECVRILYIATMPLSLSLDLCELLALIK